MFFFFFFQAEDGIRDLTVTGVQTCALPILTTKRISSTPTIRRLSAEEIVTVANCWMVPSSTAPMIGPTQLVIPPIIDRKSTRLNSSHSQISYAVFCLKKKKYHDTTVSIQPT